MYNLCISLQIFFSTLFHGPYKEYVVIMSKEGSSKIVNFMTPWAGILGLGRVLISYKVKMHYFFENILLYPQAKNRQTEYIVPRSYSHKIVNFMGRGSLIGRGHISRIVKLHYFLSNRLLYSGA